MALSLGQWVCAHGPCMHSSPKLLLKTQAMPLALGCTDTALGQLPVLGESLEPMAAPVPSPSLPWALTSSSPCPQGGAGLSGALDQTKLRP